jgi:hypothetical protein
LFKKALFIIIIVLIGMNFLDCRAKVSLDVCQAEREEIKKEVEKLKEELMRLESELSEKQKRSEIVQQDVLEHMNRDLKKALQEIERKTLCKFPWIPEELNFCGERVPLDKPWVWLKLFRAILIELNRPYRLVLGKEKINASDMRWVFIRSGRWFPMVDERLKEAGLPFDLRYLAVAESDLDPEADSGPAEGLWQFIEETAAEYGLKIDKYVNERLDPWSSTDAAIKFLKDLFRGSGNWPSALASYNMDRDIYNTQLKQEDVVSFYETTDIPGQTRWFIYRVIAIKLIMENPEKYNYPGWEEIDKIKLKPWLVKRIILDISINKERIIDIAKRYNMTYREFREFNPHIRVLKKKGEVVRDWLPKGTYNIYIPEKK